MNSVLIFAIMNNEFELNFQPEYELINGELKLIGAEALLRLTIEQEFDTGNFIEFAEENGYIKDIGEHIIKNGFKALEKWGNIKEAEKLKLSVNISPMQIKEKNFIRTVEEALEKFNVSRENIIFEIKNTEFKKDEEQEYMKKIESLREKGFKNICLDGFGRDLSSFESILKYAPMKIKIDRLFKNIKLDSL